MPYYYFKYGVLLHKGDEWQKDLYGYDPEGKGDCIFRTAIYAITKQDPEILNSLALLLKKRIRWPEDLNNDSDIKNPIFSYLYKLKKYKPRYRSPRSITRDPYVLFYTACYFLDREDFIRTINVPWWLMRPDLFFWMRWLRTGKRKKSYEFWASLSLDISLAFGMKNFALHLAAWMAYVIDSEKIKRKLIPFISHWNHLLKVLANHPLLHLDELFIENYISKEGYQWAADEWLNTSHLCKDEISHLDKDILEWAYKNYEV